MFDCYQISFCICCFLLDNIRSFSFSRFLEYSQLQGMMTSYSYETELATLQEVIQQKVATMFSDPSNVVKRTLMEKTVTKLCVFFGKQKGKLCFYMFYNQSYSYCPYMTAFSVTSVEFILSLDIQTLYYFICFTYMGFWSISTKLLPKK